MGWNSYNSFGSAVHESEVRSNAEYMAKYLKPYGWQYIVVDYCWYYPNPPGGVLNNVPQFQLSDHSYVPWLNMDSYGRLQPDKEKFPSSREGKGFKPLADYIHSLGLKFGIHIMRGIPRQAVWAHCPIKGSNMNAAEAADTSSVCTWLNHMFGLSPKGADAYYNSLIDLYNEWGVDYIKMDDMTSDEGSRPFYQSELEAMHRAIQKSGRTIVLSISPYQSRENAGSLVANANLFRVSEDFWDTWPQLRQQFDLSAAWQGAGGINHWPDLDMLQIGKLSKRGPKGPERYSRLSTDEQITHLTLWCIFGSPLMIGGNMPENTPFINSMLTNKELLDVDQNGIAPIQLDREKEKVIWVSGTRDSKDKNVALFNLADTMQEIALPLNKLGFKSKCKVRNIWHQTDDGVINKELRIKIAPHGAALYRISPI
jgi:hypothetical protein